jgi:hypothetical protein
MSVVVTSTGGARIGWINATWPFARLSANAQNLSLSVLILGTYTFSPKDVASLKPYGWLPIFARGVQVIHANPTYPPKIIFWCFGSPERLIQRIVDLGFRPSAPITAIPKREGFAFRWSFIIAVVAIWNALFILDAFVLKQSQKGLGVLSMLAVAMLFLTSVAVARSEAFQALALKPGRMVSEVRSLLNLVQLVSGVMVLALAAQYLAN